MANISPTLAIMNPLLHLLDRRQPRFIRPRRAVSTTVPLLDELDIRPDTRSLQGEIGCSSSAAGRRYNRHRVAPLEGRTRAVPIVIL